MKCELDDPPIPFVADKSKTINKNRVVRDVPPGRYSNYDGWTTAKAVTEFYSELRNLDPTFYSNFLYKIGKNPHVGTTEEAILSLKTLKEMKEFYHGHIMWHYHGGNSMKDSIYKTKCNIGAALKERKASFWSRMKWLTFFGITKSKISFA